MASKDYGLSDISSVSSEASQAPDDECLYATVGGKTTGRRNFNVTDRPSWPSQPRGSENGIQYDRVPEEVNIRVVENIPNSYCVKRVHGLKHVERDEEWNPRPTKGIIVNEDPENYKYTVNTFFDNPDQFIQEMDKCGDLCKEQREQFILLKVLPHLEEKWGKCSSSNDEVYKNLAKISCSVNSGTVVRHALHLLLRLVCKDNLGSGHGKLQVAEGVLRSSIVSPEGKLRKDEHSEGQLKLFVYSRILTLLFLQQVQQEKLPLLALELELNEVKKILKGYSEHIQNKKKDVFRYAMEYIITIIPYLLQPHEKSKIKGLITKCQEFCGYPQIKSEGILETVKKIPKGEWIGLHCILIYLQGKMHNESPIVQMESEFRAMKLFGLIVGTCLEERRWGSDWKFCLIALSILADIADSNITKEMRKEANSCLKKLLKDAKVQKKPECRAILEQQSSKFVFCKDVETRKLVVEFWFNDLDPPNHLPAANHTEHLSSMYRTQTLEINETSVCKKSACFVNHGMFHRQKVAIKVLNASKRHLLEDDPNFKDRQRLIREVYNMGRLNTSQHPNIPVLLGYDTESLPYHLITAFERWGNLLQLLRLSRDLREPHFTPKHLVKMILDISRALLFLEGLGFVHRAVMAENVLVGSNFVCKLSGLHFMRQLRSSTSDEDLDTEDGYCSPNQFIPEYFSTSGEEDPPVRWRAPECLTKNRYSTASDVWAFGVLMYEVLTFGRIPYEHVLNDDALHIRIVDHKEIVPRESCFEDKEYELIKQFCEWKSNYRLSRFAKVIERLQELLKHHDQQRYSENLRSSPPGSTEHIGSQDSRTAPSSDLEGEARCGLIRKTEKGRTFVWEKISNDFLHVKGLLELKDPNLVSVEYSTMDDSGLYWIISPECPNENLKEYVLNRQGKLEHMVVFLSQVASALHYLHVNHIVHGDLRAEYVNVVAPDKVKVGRLGRSKHLSMNVDDKGTSKLCVKQADMSPDAHRWSAPEVISDGLYTHASDVWAFGILAWELYTSFTKGQDRRDLSVPYCGLYKDEILPYMRKTGPLDKPEDCPYWVYVIMHQCWTFSSGQRPPFLAIFDCLTSREPMKSWLMERWKQRKGKESDFFPDLHILQEEDSSHVLGEEKHPSKEDIERMCLEGFFAEHGYRYVRDEGNDKDCHIYDDVTPKLEAVELQQVPPGNQANAVIHTDFEDEHQSNIEGACQNVHQQKATHKIVAERNDKGRRPKSLQEWLDDRYSEVEYLI